MADDLIPQAVREFISENIDSIAELEALILLFRDPDREWGVSALAERLYARREQTEKAIAKLCQLGLSAANGGAPETFRYQPATPELQELVGDIAETYSKYLIPVTNLIHSKPESKVQQFADAFRLRKRRDK